MSLFLHQHKASAGCSAAGRRLGLCARLSGRRQRRSGLEVPFPAPSCCSAREAGSSRCAFLIWVEKLGDQVLELPNSSANDDDRDEGSVSCAAWSLDTARIWAEGSRGVIWVCTACQPLKIFDFFFFSFYFYFFSCTHYIILLSRNAWLWVLKPPPKTSQKDLGEVPSLQSPLSSIFLTLCSQG